MRLIRHCALLTALAACTSAAAQGPQISPPSPLGLGQGESKDQPVQIEAATLEVRDKNKTATFSGHVEVVQGDTTMKCQTLVVFYGQEVGLSADGATAAAAAAPAAATKTAPGMPQGAQNIRRIEARGGVTVITKDQSASGELAVYDLKTHTIALSGNVVVSQGQNVIHGERVVVDTATGNARVESSSSGGTGGTGPAPGRVRALIQPGKGQNGGGANMMTIGPGRPN
jgi:lipopolysaccharide export system protein LptA